MNSDSDVEIADRLSRRRARMIPVLAVIFLSGQAAYFSQDHAERMVDHVRIGAWLVWVIVLLLLLGTGGGFIQRREVRALINDETTKANRQQTFAVGFWTAMGMAIGLYVVTMFDEVSAREAIHLIVTGAIAGALLMFGMLERRAHRDA
jgi:MFS family permease